MSSHVTTQDVWGSTEKFQYLGPSRPEKRCDNRCLLHCSSL